MNHTEKYEFLKHVGELFEGTLAPADGVRLAKILAENAEAPTLYLEMLELDVDLESLCGTRLEPEIFAAAKRMVSESAAEDRDIHEQEVAKAVPIVLTTLHRATSLFRSRMMLCYILFVAVCFYGTFALIAWNLRAKPDFGNAESWAVNSDDPPTTQVDSGSLAQITRADDAAWVSSPESGIAPSHRSLLVNSGFAELKFAQGARVVVEGPAEFEVHSGNAGFLRHGTLVARVSREAIGFSVLTPTAAIVDLGTEFGVKVKKSGETAVHVFKGVVETTEVMSSSPSRRSKSRKVSAGESVAFDGSNATYEKAAVNSEIFAPLSKQFNIAPVLDSYIQTVLADRPLAYWPLNEPKGSTEIADLSGNGHAGKVKGEIEFGCEWPVSKTPGLAARFSGKGSIEIANATDLALQRDFSVEAWIQCEAKTCENCEHILSVSNWGWGRMPSHLRASPFIRTSKGKGAMIPDIRLDLPEWRHLAMVFDANNQVHLYIGGLRSATHRYSSEAAEGTVQAAISGYPANSGPWIGETGPGYWTGSIAHLAVYAHSLDAKTIAKHLQSATRP
jgi:hypothetical protein